ncbi:MAG: hypothetical protein ABSG37_04675 [Candidatus Limnocylindrales bacterium]|jgi:hypothetical protein
MEREPARPTPSSDPEETRHRLASEVAEVESAMALVISGSASRITLSGLRFGDQVARRFDSEARSKGVRLEPILWPEDAGCDLIVRKIDE